MPSRWAERAEFWGVSNSRELVVVTKHSTGPKTSPNFGLTLACLAFSHCCWCRRRVSGVGLTVCGSLCVCVCAQMDGPLGMQSYIPKRGDGGQGSKPQLTSPHSSVSGDFPGIRDEAALRPAALCSLCKLIQRQPRQACLCPRVCMFAWKGGCCVCLFCQIVGVCAV